MKDNDDLADSDPETAHWVLENGRTEALNPVQKKFAYGILSQERLGKNRFRIMLDACKDRKIIVEKVDGDYKAIVSINGIESILDKIYVNAEENRLGLPRVAFIDVFGRTLNAHFPLRERILPR